MTKYFYFLFALLAHTQLLSQNFPDIDQSIRYEQSDFSEIDQLLKDGLPNKAISKLLTRQLIANSTQNLNDLQACYIRLERAFKRSGKEKEDLQYLLFEQHKIFEQATGPAKNIAADALIGLVKQWYFRKTFSFDDESLEWTINGVKVKLQNGNSRILEEYYEAALIKNADALMRISSLALFDSSQVKYLPTLYDVFAWKRISALRYEPGNEGCYLGSTDEFLKQDLPELFQIMATLEQLNRKHARWDSYAFVLENRIDLCEDNESKVNLASERFQKELSRYPASNRFALKRAVYYANQANQYDWKMPSIKDNGFLEAQRIIKQALKDHPDSDFTEQLVAYKKNIEKTSLSFSLNGVDYPQKRSLLSLTYRNLESAHIAIYKVLEGGDVNRDDKNPLKNLKLKMVSNRDLKLNSQHKMLTHTKDFILTDLDETGIFMVIVASTKEKLKDAFDVEDVEDLSDRQISYQVINLSNLMVRSSTVNNVFSILVNDVQTGKPIKGAKVTTKPRFRSDDDQTFFSGETDENGYLVLSSSSRVYFTVEYKGDKTSGDSYFRNYNSRESDAFKVFTDRSIYRPGQSVYYKTLALHQNVGESNLLTDKLVVVEFLDQNNEVIYSNKVKTNAFGSAEGSFVLPKRGMPLGLVQVRVEGVWVATFSVEEYKRPTFEVTFDKPKGRVVLGEPFTMTGKVMAYAGYPISNAEVTVDVSENRFFPYRCFVLDEWRSYDTTIVVTTDVNGEFTFNYTSDKPKDAYGVYYNFEGKVTDLSGEVQMANHSLYLGKTAYTIRAEVEDKYLSENAIELDAKVFNSQNEAEANVDLSYEIEKMDARDWYLYEKSEAEFKGFSRREYVRDFPKTRYYKNQKVRYASVKTGTFKSGTKETVSKLQPGNYRLIFAAVDEVGDTVKSDYEFIVWNKNNKRKQHKSEFWVETSPSQPIVGEEIEIYLGSSFRKTRLMIAKYDQDGLISLDYKKLKKRKNLTETITEKDKAGLAIYYSIVKNGRVYNQLKNLTPVDSSKMMDLKLKHISEPLRPGTKQSWEIQLTQKGAPIKNAEMLVSMYDASLDAFRNHSWSTGLILKSNIRPSWNEAYRPIILQNHSNWYAASFYLESNRNSRFENRVEMEYMLSEQRGIQMSAKSIPPPSPGDPAVLADEYMDLDANFEVDEAPREAKPEAESNPRENFNETAFFKPQIYATAEGKYTWNFTLPDALTKWKMMAFAHTTDLKSIFDTQTFEARKELMMETFEPRFWRKGDSLFWVGKVVNLSEKEQTVTVNLKIESLLDEQDVSTLFGDFQTKTIVLQPNESQAVEWPIVISKLSPNFVRFEAEASTAEFADVVRKNMPVLEGQTRVILAQNYVIEKKGKHDIELDDARNISDNAEIISYSVSAQKQPLWSTMLSLTQILQPTNELNESYFSQYYGAVLARKILKDNPKMKQVLAKYQITDEDALTSNLMKNDELKTLILAETPWLLEAKSETEQLNRLGQLLDDNHLDGTIEDALSKLKEMQLSDGSWSWVGRERSSWYMTQHFASGLAELAEYGVEIDQEMFKKAVSALDKEYTKRYDRLEERDKLKEVGLGALEINWLYIRSVLNLEETKVSKYYAQLVPKKWTNFNLNTQATIGKWALKSDDRTLAKKVMASFQDKARSQPSLGKYWRGNENGYGWFDGKIEAHANLIAFYQQYGDMNESVAAMQKWLLLQKQTQMWDTPKSTAMACFAMKDFGAGAEEQTVRISFGTDNYQDSLADFSKVSPEIQDLKAVKKGAELSTSTDGLVIASTQVVYSDEVSKIVKSTGDFRVERHYYILEKGEEIEASETRLMKVGDVVRVKIKLISDRDLDFVYLEDPKAAGWEPKNPMSGYRYENGFYYLSNRDSKTEFFIENLRKGTYIYTYDVKVTAKGKLHIGPAKATCYYAPSFSSNTQGLKVEIE